MFLLLSKPNEALRPHIIVGGSDGKLATLAVHTAADLRSIISCILGLYQQLQTCTALTTTDRLQRCLAVPRFSVTVAYLLSAVLGSRESFFSYTSYLYVSCVLNVFQRLFYITKLYIDMAEMFKS